MTAHFIHFWQLTLTFVAACLLSMTTGCQILDCSTSLVEAPVTSEPESVRELLGNGRSKEMYKPSLPPPVQTETEAEKVDNAPSVYAVDPQVGTLLYDTDAAAAKDQDSDRAAQEWEASEPPRELSMVSHPAYRIEAPDLLKIEVLRLAPRPPRHIDSYDYLTIRVRGTSKDMPIQNTFRVDSEGKVTLGPVYGTVLVSGLTLEEARDRITRSLKRVLPNPEVSVQLEPSENDVNLSDIYKVESDGTVILNRYGAVHVAGKTTAEASRAIEEHLAWYFDSPRVGVDVFRYQSQFYYVIIGSSLGDKNMWRLPIMGNETVLDAIGQLQGLSRYSSKTIWIARPAPTSVGRDQILMVDWDAVARGGLTDTNYQLLPGDRLYIVDDKAYALNNFVGKIVSPLERMLGIAELGSDTSRGMQVMGREFQQDPQALVVVKQ